MLRRRGTAVASALLLSAAALVAAGCGLGAGAGVGEVSLRVTRDFGAAPVSAPVRDDASESDTVMRVLDRDAEIETSYGGRYVRAIDGLGEATRGGRRYDWFFFVNGIEASVGAADFPLRGGEAIWWDYRDWSRALYVPAVVGSWPEPLLDGYEGKRHPVAVECRGGGGACGVVRARLADAGVEVAAGAPDDAIRLLVGPWARLRADPAAAQLERGPQTSGVYAKFTPAPAPAPPEPAVPVRVSYRRGTKLAPEAPNWWDSMRAARRRGGSGPAPAWSPRPAASTRRRSGSSPARRLAACAPPRICSMRPICVTATRWRLTEAGRETPLPLEAG